MRCLILIGVCVGVVLVLVLASFLLHCQWLLLRAKPLHSQGHNANAILPAPPEAKHAEQRAVAPGEALVQAEAKEFSRAEQRQWLLSRAQKLHAVKDQLQQLRRLQQLGPEIQKDEFRMSERTQAAQRTCRWHKMVCRKCESN